MYLGEMGMGPPGSFPIPLNQACPAGAVFMGSDGNEIRQDLRRTWCYYPSGSGGSAAPQAPAANITVSPTIATQVSPQVSPVFQQQYQPSNSPLSAGTQQGSNVAQPVASSMSDLLTALSAGLAPTPVSTTLTPGPVTVEKPAASLPDLSTLPPLPATAATSNPWQQYLPLILGGGVVLLLLLMTKGNRHANG